jgi:hypothetical protein
MLLQKLTEWNVEIICCVRFCHRGGLLIETQDVAQHAQKARVQQIAALCKHRIQIGTCPLQSFASHRHFDRERHIRGDGFYLQILK